MRTIRVREQTPDARRESLLRPQRLSRSGAGFGIAVVGSYLAVLAADLSAMEHMRILPFFAVVIASTVVGRLAVGIASAVGATLLVDYFVVPPIHALNPEQISDQIALGLFLSVAIATALVVSHLDRLQAERKLSADRLRFIAAALQRRLLPSDTPEVPDTDIAVGYWSATGDTEVGGDFYDLFQPEPHRWLAVVGDVAGKGPEAAAFVGIARAALRAHAVRNEEPEQLLMALNRSLTSEMRDWGFCTMCVVQMTLTVQGVIDLRVACAGHPAPQIVRRNGAIQVVRASGTLLGVVDDVTISEDRTILEPGDTLAMFTDGLYERPSRRGQGVERDLLSLFAEAQSVSVSDLIERIEGELESGPLNDDIAVMLIKNVANNGGNAPSVIHETLGGMSRTRDRASS